MPDYIFSGSTAINSATASFTTAHLCYYHKQSDHLQFGVELEANFRMQVFDDFFFALIMLSCPSNKGHRLL